MARNATKSALKSTTTPVVSIADRIASWTDGADKARTALADIGAAIVKDLDLTAGEAEVYLRRPKTADEKANNRHVMTFTAVWNLLEENIVVDGQRITPETVKALRDKNVEGRALLQGIQKSGTKVVGGKTPISWNGQISARFGDLRKAIHAAAGVVKERAEKEDAVFMKERLQAMFNKANKSETFDLADLAAFNSALTNIATMIGVKLDAVK